VLIAGTVEAIAAQAAIDAVNAELPHYRQIRNFKVIGAAFTAESGLLTANGKLRRDAVNTRYAAEINAMYDAKGQSTASASSAAESQAVNRQHA